MQATWQERWQGRVLTEADLLVFLADVGCCAINELPKFPAFPSHQVGMNTPDVLWHTWFWKDDLHTQRKLYYTRIFGGKPGYIALDLLPAFIATHGAVADELMLTGGLSALGMKLYQLIEENGPISSRNVKKLLGKEERKSASRALIDLESLFMITKTEITGRERGTYGYVWDLAERWMPEAFAESDRLGVKGARTLIRERLERCGIPDDSPLYSRVLKWPETVIQRK